MLLSLMLGACVELVQAPPPSDSLFSPVETIHEPSPERPFVGLVLEEELLGSLDQLEFGAGLRVIEVAPGSPAERAGIQAGDLLAGAGGVAVNGIDQWQALLDRLAPGDTLELEVERAQGSSAVEVKVAERGGQPLLTPRWFVERFKLRAGFETVANDSGLAARVTELFPGSPLIPLGVEPGTGIRALDGQKVQGGQELARLVAARPYGDTLSLEIEDARGVRTVECDLWEPERTLTRLSVPILFGYRFDPAEDQVEFSLIDVWLLAVYDYRRDVHTRRHRFLRFFVFETGAGELAELPGPRGAEDGGPEPAR